MNKEYFRSEMLKRRKSMPLEEVSLKSEEIFKRVKELGTGFFKDSVFIYVSFDNEADTSGIIGYFLENQITVSVPVMASDNSISAFEIDSTDSFVKNRCGIYEPKQGREIAADRLTSIIVPGIVFDLQRHRIGYGRGCYDRYLKDLSAQKIALSYDFQVLPQIPFDESDVKMDIIITDSRIIQ